MRLGDVIAGVIWLCNLTCLSEAKPIEHVPIAFTGHEYHNSIQSSTNASTNIHKRAEWLADLGSGWAGYIQTWDSFIPRQIAASVLTQFYAMILDKAVTTSLDEPTLFRAFEWDNIRLEFSSDVRKIPWEFVAVFATKMAAVTQRGFTGQFNAVYVHMATEHSIRISLMVLENYVGSGRI